MAIVKGITKRAEIPHEPGEWMELRRLSWRQLEQASDAQSDAALQRIKKLGGDLIGALRGLAGDQEQNPAAKYDRAVVLKSGIVNWSYNVPVTPENIDDLDKETADWAVEEILGMHAPRTEEERKND